MSSSSRHALVAAVALLSASARAETTLDPLLKKIGEQLAAAQTVPACSMVERTTVEELDSDKKVKASEVHTYRVERSGRETKRTRLGVQKGVGALSPRLRPKPDEELSKEEKERRANFRTPFHLEEQAKYRFSWAQAPENGRATIAFAPHQPEPERGTGVATVDVNTGQLLTMRSKPSKFPPFLSEMDSRMGFADTPCGLLPTRFEMSGEGGLLFLRSRFRFVTVMEGHAVR